MRSTMLSAAEPEVAISTENPRLFQSVGQEAQGFRRVIHQQNDVAGSSAKGFLPSSSKLMQEIHEAVEIEGGNIGCGVLL